jgi:glycyl-tRNA synthetase beta chain
LPSIHEYKKQLLKLGVIVDQEERKELIKEQVTLAATKAGGKALVPDDLLSEVTFLVENPLAYAGKFKPEFLSIPQAVLITSMKKNQKYFPVVDKAGRLLPKFIVVTDACRNRKVVEGNQKVLSARLADAKFFFEEDRKEPLKLRIPDLDRVAYFEKLGNLGQKAARLVKLAEWLGQRLRLTEEETRIAKRIAELCKTDLTTKMVYEFPELQGEMGREYALLSGEDPRVALGILEHYLPRFAEDRLPQTLPGKIVALADRLDLLVGCFSLGSIPTGSVDPYGLRRAVVGMIRIISENKLDLLLDETFAAGLKLYEPIIQTKVDADQLRRQLLEFIAGRLKPVLQEQGTRYDVIDAVLADYNDILDVAMKAKAINGLVSEAWFVGVVKSADRLFRITKEVKEHDVRAADFVDPQEKTLYELYLKTNWEVGEAIKKESWLAAIQSLAKLTEPIEQFFDKVLVMHEDERIRRNRLALIKSLEILYSSVADLKKIVV